MWLLYNCALDKIHVQWAKLRLIQALLFLHLCWRCNSHAKSLHHQSPPMCIEMQNAGGQKHYNGNGDGGQQQAVQITVTSQASLKWQRSSLLCNFASTAWPHTFAPHTAVSRSTAHAVRAAA